MAKKINRPKKKKVNKKNSIAKLKSAFDKSKKNVDAKKLELDIASGEASKVHSDYMNALVEMVHCEEALNIELNKQG